MDEHKSQDELLKEIDDAKKLIKVNGIYSHYKSLDNHYRVVDIAILEATDEPCVIYKALYGNNITFVRAVSVWIQKVEFNDTVVPRFSEVV